MCSLSLFLSMLFSLDFNGMTIFSRTLIKYANDSVIFIQMCLFEWEWVFVCDQLCKKIWLAIPSEIFSRANKRTSNEQTSKQEWAWRQHTKSYQNLNFKYTQITVRPHHIITMANTHNVCRCVEFTNRFQSLSWTKCKQTNGCRVALHRVCTILSSNLQLYH